MTMSRQGPADDERMEQRDRLITVQELAEYLGVPVATLYQWRHRREGSDGFASEDTSATDGPKSRPGSNGSLRTPTGDVSAQPARSEPQTPGWHFRSKIVQTRLRYHVCCSGPARRPPPPETTCRPRPRVRVNDEVVIGGRS